MLKDDKKLKHKFPLLIIVILLLALGIFLFLYFRVPSARRDDYRRIASENYDSVFLSMYPIGEYRPEDFSFYRGMTLLKTSCEIPDAVVLEEYLSRIAKSGNTINTIYLGVVPGHIESSELLALLQQYPSVIFEIIPAYPSIEYWKNLPEQEYIQLLSDYEALITPLLDLQNIHFFSFFAQEWFIANPANYLSENEITAEISQLVMLNADGDHPYLLTSKNMEPVMDSVSALIQKARQETTASPDLSDWSVVFFGDSIIANYTNSTSVPGVLSGLSGAQTLSYAVGGSSAAWLEDESASFPKVVERFLAENPDFDADGRNICFAINFGLNDYFNGFPVEDASDSYNTKTYAGALRSGIELLKSAFPDAYILVMSPNFASYFKNGTEKRSESGGILTDYVAAAETVARDMNVVYMNNYSGLGITAENQASYLLDGCHLNEAGRYLLGSHMVQAIHNMKAQ